MISEDQENSSTGGGEREGGDAKKTHSSAKEKMLNMFFVIFFLFWFSDGERAERVRIIFECLLDPSYISQGVYRFYKVFVYLKNFVYTVLRV